MKTSLRKLFRRITPKEIAAAELAEAEVALLSAHTGKEYADSLIAYRNSQIKRLRKFLADVELEAA